MALSALLNLRNFRSCTTIASKLINIPLESRNVSTLCCKTLGLPLLVGSQKILVSASDQRRHYAMKLELKEHGIIWRRPEYIPSWYPEKAGDLKPLVIPDGSRPSRKCAAAKEAFEQADEETKKFLSLAMTSRREHVKVARIDTFKRLRRHKYDVGSMECQIASLTVKIRNLQGIMQGRGRKNVILKCRLIERIAQRKKLLKHLRRMDYKRFEWLLEKLDLEYKPFPKISYWITRRESLRKLVQMEKDDMISKRMEEYKAYLKSQEEAFMKEKAETLEWIAKAEEELKLPITANSTQSKHT